MDGLGGKPSWEGVPPTNEPLLRKCPFDPATVSWAGAKRYTRCSQDLALLQEHLE